MIGRFHIYSGPGKGKTTCAAGLALRALAAGWKVLLAQFLKSGDSGEIGILQNLGADILVDSSHHRFIIGRSPEQSEIQAAQQLWQKISAEALKYQLVILDEGFTAVTMGMLEPEPLTDLINICRKQGIEIVLTGRMGNSVEVAEQILELADLVTWFEARKHYYDSRFSEKQNFEARQGIEY